MIDDIHKNDFPFQDLIVNTCVISFVLDHNSKLLQANQDFFDLIGYEEDYFENNLLASLMVDEEKWSHLKDTLQKNDNRLSITLKLHTASGKPVFLKCNIGLKKDKVFFIGIDVSEDMMLNDTLKTVTTVANVGGWTYVPSEDKISCTEAVYQLLDVEKTKKVDSDEVLKYIHPDYQERIRQLNEALLQEQKKYDTEVKVITATERTIWVRIIAIPEIFNDEVVFVHGVLQDIDKYKSQEVYLEETQINMELALRAMNSGYFTQDLKKDILKISGSFRTKMNLDNELTKEQFLKHIHPEDRDEALIQHNNEIQSDDVYYVNAYRMKSSNGKYKHFEVHGFKVFDSKNTAVKLAGNLIDVEDKYRLTQLQDKHRYHVKTLLDNNFVRSIMLDNDWNIRGLDAHTSELFISRLGHNPVMKKTNFKKILTSHDLLKFNIIERVLNKGEEYRKEVHLDLFEDDRTYYDALFKPILDYSNMIDGYVFYFFDLTDQLRAQEELQSFQDKLRTVHHFKNNIITKIGDEIKTPLDGLIQTTKMIFQKETSLSADEDLIRAQQESANRLMHTFDNIINSSMYEDNFFVIKEKVDLTAILDHMLQNAVNRSNLKGLNLIFTNFDKSAHVLADPVFLKQAMENLLDNAFKHTSKGCISITTNIVDNHAEITLQDTGLVTLRPDFKEFLEWSKSVEEGDDRNYEGIGLGLTFALKYIEGIGGHFHVDNTQDAGSKFVLAIPLQ